MNAMALVGGSGNAQRDQQRGVRWFATLTHAAEGEAHDVHGSMLQHAVQLYGLYVQTQDTRYLNLCEEFLKCSLV